MEVENSGVMIRKFLKYHLPRITSGKYLIFFMDIQLIKRFIEITNKYTVYICYCLL